MIDLQSINLAANDYCELVKQNGNTSVYRADIPKLGAIIIKQYELPTLLSRLSFRRKQKKITRLYDCVEKYVFFPKLFHVGMTPDKKFGHVVYRQVKGVDLRKIEWDGFDDKLIDTTGEKIAECLYSMHREGWIHGDFKFGNIMLDLSAKAKGNVVEVKIKDGALEPVLKNKNFNLYVVDIEAAVKPNIFLAGKKSRDVARFLINAEELGVRPLGLAFWSTYQSLDPSLKNKNANVAVKFRQQVEKWCEKFSVRHHKKYEKIVKIDYLS
ncbi:MAG: hypothetical protein ACRBCS_04950 [Cellvibrionaceae bacterium]